MKGVLFVLGRFCIGGAEKVTVDLANEFARRGYSVSVAAFQFDDNSLRDQLDARIELVSLSFPVLSRGNCRTLRSHLQVRGIDCIINQWSMPFKVSLLLLLVRQRGTKIISVYHTQPGESKLIAESSGIKKFLIKTILRVNMRLTYAVSSSCVVLSPSFIPIFEKFAGLVHGKKLVAIPDSVVLREAEGEKENLIVYVGRLANAEKRVDRVINTWRKLHEQLPNWRLAIVGDGPDRQALQMLAGDLPRISFEGYQDPTPYYARAKVLLLTSEFEGFGLVLVEAMGHGCVPVGLGSYAAIYDIIDSTCGLILPVPFDPNQFATEVKKLIDDESRWIRLSRKGIEVARRYSVQNTVERYLKVVEGKNV